MGKWIRLFIFAFLLFGAYTIYQAADYNLHESDDRSSFVKEIGHWLWDVGKKTKNVVGYVIAESWLPDSDSSENSTNSTNLNTSSNGFSQDVTITLG